MPSKDVIREIRVNQNPFSPEYAGLALVPVALGAGKPGSEIQAPMAIVILSGLFTSTLLNMIVIPSVLSRVGWNKPL